MPKPCRPGSNIWHPRYKAREPMRRSEHCELLRKGSMPGSTASARCRQKVNGKIWLTNSVSRARRSIASWADGELGRGPGSPQARNDDGGVIGPRRSVLQSPAAKRVACSSVTVVPTGPLAAVRWCKTASQKPVLNHASTALGLSCVDRTPKMRCSSNAPPSVGKRRRFGL